MNKEADRRQVEETVAVGLIHEPKRLDELSQFKLGYFLLPECRLIYWVVAEHRRQNLLQGKIRYAGKQAIGRGIDEWVSIDSMQQVSAVLAVFMARWCGLNPRTGI